MKTAWLKGLGHARAQTPSLVDLHLRKLTDLPAALFTSFPAFA